MRKFGFLGDQYFDPTGLLVDEDGNHYVADGKGNRILKWDENATPLSIIATSGSAGGSVKEPRQMDFGPSGIYAVERNNNGYPSSSAMAPSSVLSDRISTNPRA